MNSSFLLPKSAPECSFFLLSILDLLWCQSARLKTTFDDIEDLTRQERSRQQRISNAREALNAAERELQDVQPYEPPRAEMVSLVTLFHDVLLCIYAVFCLHL